MNMRHQCDEEEGDRLKSVPPSASVEMRANDGGASPAPTTDKTLAVKAALTALRIYKVYLSILFAGNCRFQPTCSMYMYEAIERFGVMRGSWMGLKRLLRCQPLSRKFGFDPVPEKTDAAELHAGGSGRDDGRSGVRPREAHS
jgi:uncharacterized protein